MKIYKKPEIEIVEFFISDNTTANSGSDVVPDFDFNSDEVFYGIDAGEEGYIVE